MAKTRKTLRLEESLLELLEQVARGSGQTESEVIREALRRYLPKAKPRENCFQLAKRLGFIGAIEDLPSDLSVNPKHFRGFGK